MRYLIIESDWPTMAFALDLSAAGIPLSRTDRLEDLPLYCASTAPDVVICAGSLGCAPSRLFRANPLPPVAVLLDETTLQRSPAWLQAGAAVTLNAADPFVENAAKLLAVMRRNVGFASPVIRYGPLSLDLSTRQAFVNNRPLALAPKLYAVLEFLALRPNRVVTRDALLGHVYGLEDEPGPRVFDVYLAGLRRALQPVRPFVQLDTVRGAGFRFTSASSYPRGEVDGMATAHG